MDWFNALPLPWYFERSADDLSVACAKNASQLGRFDGSYPPVVIALTGDADAIASRLDGYTSHEYLLRTNADRTTFFFAPEAIGTNDTAASRQLPRIDADTLHRGVSVAPVAARSMDTHPRAENAISMGNTPVSVEQRYGRLDP